MNTKWNLKLLYKNLNDPQIEKDIAKNKKLISDFINKWKNNSEYITSPEVLKVALEEYEFLLEKYGVFDKPGYYLALMRSLNQEDTNLKALENKLHSQYLQAENNLQFFILNISKISKELQSTFLHYKPLSKYRHFLEHLFNSSQYLLSDKEEKVFNVKAKTSHSNWVSMVEELLSKQMLSIIDENGRKISIPYSEASKYLNSTNKKVRDYTAKKFLEINKKYSEIAEYELNSVLENKKLSDEYRNVLRPDALRHLADDIDTDIVDTLVEVVTENFDIPQRFYKLKAKQLNQKELQYYERNLPILDKNKEYTFKESFELVKDVFGKLDSEFEKHITNLNKNGQYDAFPKKGKSNGAFCISLGNKRYPSYILLNHTNKLNDTLTLAHESGHALHSEYSNSQSPLNSGHSTATAEVASTFFEDFVLEDILNKADEELKVSLMFKKLDDDISTIFRQIACYNFETELHKNFREKGFLSKQDIGSIFTTEMSKYCGNAVKQDEHMEYGWIYWSHIRRFFYVYTYASGLLISKSLQASVREDPNFIGNVKTFFKAGTINSPKEIFLEMGIDISKKEFWEKGIDEIRKQLNDLETYIK